MPTDTETITEHFRSREEFRFLLDPISSERLTSILDTAGFTEIKHAQPIVENIYFTSPDLVAPAEGYVRLRRYVDLDKLVSMTMPISDDEIWFLEAKPKHAGKERVQITAREALAVLSNRSKLYQLLPNSELFLNSFPAELIPIAAIQWLRRHFLVPNQNLRVTIDNSIRYFGFVPGTVQGVYIGDQVKTKVEIKGDLQEKDISHVLPEVAWLMENEAEPIPDGWQENELRRIYARSRLKHV